MTSMIVAPEMMTSAAADLATIGSHIDAAHLAAAAHITSVTPAAADEVSAGIAQLLSQHGSGFQALAGQASVFHSQFTQNLKAGAAAYTSTEAASTLTLDSWLATLPGGPALVSAIGSALNGLPGPLAGIGTVFEQDPVGFLLGIPLFFLLIPVDLLFFLLLPFLGILVAA